MEGPPWYNISIHTTLAGGDVAIYICPSRHHTISIHTTLAGGDYGKPGSDECAGISIHTTLAGGDHYTN